MHLNITADMIFMLIPGLMPLLHSALDGKEKSFDSSGMACAGLQTLYGSRDNTAVQMVHQQLHAIGADTLGIVATHQHLCYVSM